MNFGLIKNFEKGENMTSKLKIALASILMVLLILSGGYCIYFFAKPSENKKVVTTIFPLYDIVRNIMGHDNDLLLLEDNGADIHNYSPSASDMTAIAKCELFVYIGGESDKWVPDVLKSTNNVNLYTVKMLDEIEALEESEEGIISNHEHEHENEEEHAEEEVEYDEHIWLTPKNLIIMAEVVRDNLNLIFPERQEIFRLNTEKYIQKLQALDSEYQQVCTDSTQTLIVADRFPFAYLTHDYNLKYYACFSGCSTETQASADMLSKLIDKINSEDAKYICVLESSDKVIANSAIGDKECKNGVDILTLNSCQSVSIAQKDEINLLDVLKSNLEVIKKVFEK